MALFTTFVAAVILSRNPSIWTLIVIATLWRLWKRGPRSTAYGSARWAEPKDIPNLLRGSGLILGHIEGRASKLGGLLALLSPRLDSREACRKFLTAFQSTPATHLVRLAGGVHTAVFSPSGVGKGVSIVIPHLLTCTDSMVVVDFKGELASLTAEARRQMGHRVVILDPYRQVTQHSDQFNPIEFIDKDSPTALDDCRDIAAALVVRSGQEREPHFSDSAEIWIAAFLVLIVTHAEGAEKSLQSLRSLLTDPEKMELGIKIMCESQAMDGMLARLGHQLMQFKDKERASTLTTTNRFLRFADTPAIAECTSTSTFNPADLRNGKTTVYLVLPPDRVRAQTGLLRMWIVSLMMAVVKGGLQEQTKVHFVLDEAASLGHMDVLDDAVDKFRGYGVRLLFIWQSLGQLRKCFPDGQDQTFLSNVTQVFFGVNDQQTAEYVSARLGESTMVVQSGGTSESRSRSSGAQPNQDSSSTSANQNWQYMGRKLLKPEEVAALPARVAITFAPGVPPIATRLVRYYEKEFMRLRGMGLIRAAFETLRVIIGVVLLTLMYAVAVANHILQ